MQSINSDSLIANQQLEIGNLPSVPIAAALRHCWLLPFIESLRFDWYVILKLLTQILQLLRCSLLEFLKTFWICFFNLPVKPKPFTEIKDGDSNHNDE